MDSEKRSNYAPLERSQDGIGYVYFLGTSDGERVKIGWSKDLSLKRLKTHKEGDAFGRGGDYHILALVRGTASAEDQAQKYYKAHAVPGETEVFFAGPLIPYITYLRDFYFVSTTAEEFASDEGRTVIDENLWLPGPGKVSDRSSERRLLALSDPWSVLPSRIRTGDDYYTPDEYMECIRAALGGHIDLDPASHVVANRVVKAKRFYTKDQNGLLQPWAGRVYLNPPFSSWPEWVPKVLSEVASGSVQEIVCLGAIRTITAQYFQPLLDRNDAFCIIRGRRGFWGIQTENDSPTDGHFLIYIGPNVDRFLLAVGTLGTAWPSLKRIA